MTNIQLIKELKAKLGIARAALGTIEHNDNLTLEKVKELARRTQFNIRHYNSFKKHDVEDD